ncbi:MAG TPA: long-chain fatty acid--CoA ligase, partial [Thermodesulfobacteriota bacterium]|nr:long-chain fatty acid--CoA ligase [Thermodesulfobacteriota bacterium]
MEPQIWHKHKWPKEVPLTLSYTPQPLFQILDDRVKESPDQPYTIFADHHQTYRQIWEMANKVATFLVQKGIKPGDRVALFLPNLPHFPVAFFGVLKAGAVCVTCNPLYTAKELNFQLKDSGAEALFVLDHPVFYPTALEAIKETSVKTVVVCGIRDFVPGLKGIIGSLLGKIPKAPSLDPAHIKFQQVLATSPNPPSLAINPVEDLALILYTGGTTGVPKGASLTHNNIRSNLAMLDEWALIEPEGGGSAKKLSSMPNNTFLGVLPWYHSYGLTLTLLTCCAGGFKVVCVPDPRAGNPPFTEVLRLIQQYKVTVLHGVPTLYSAIINHPLVQQFDLKSIVYCASGAAPLPIEVAKRFEELTGAIVLEGYGLSETSPVTHTNPTNRRDRKFGSIGLPLPETYVKILDVDTPDKELAQGEDGEIAISGPQVMKGYWNRPEDNASVFKVIEGKRFFLTGDIGHLDEEGFTVITDRKKDMIIVGGLKAFPREVEEVLYTHPKVANAAVVGIPSSKSGEQVKAFIQLKPGETATEEEIIQFCQERMAPYKRPHSVEFREALP